MTTVLGKPITYWSTPDLQHRHDWLAKSAAGLQQQAAEYLAEAAAILDELDRRGARSSDERDARV